MRFPSCSHHPSTSMTADDSSIPHESGHPLASTTSSPGCQFRMDAWRAIGATTRIMYLMDLAAQVRIRTRTSGRYPIPPSIVATDRNPEHPAHSAHGVMGLLSLNERKRR
jgi:hypothetical protein